MHDVLRVDVFEGFGQVVADLGDVARRYPGAAQPFLQVHAPHQGHHDVPDPAAAPIGMSTGVEHGDQVVVVEPSQNGQLDLFARRVHAADVEILDGHRAPEGLVVRSVHGGEPAAPDDGFQAVSPAEKVACRVCCVHGFITSDALLHSARGGDVPEGGR